MIKRFEHYTYYILAAIAMLVMPMVSPAKNLEEDLIVYIYKDDGVSEEALLQTFFTLKENLPAKYRIQTISAQEVMQNEWIKNAVLFVMPGGADLLYAKKLNGKGNRNIKDFVKNGGAYLGICAGSYYGASYVEFDKGGGAEVSGKRELAFFPGKAIGPILARYSYKDNSGARAAKLNVAIGKTKEANVYYSGGGFFKDAENYNNVSVIAYYQLNNGKLPAVIGINYGQGNVILSGVHFEYNPFLLDGDDLYLKKIIPDLKQSAEARKGLIQEILAKLKLCS